MQALNLILTELSIMAVQNTNTSDSPRLLSLDAYRGLIMLCLAFNGFGLEATAKRALEKSPDSTFWQAVKYQFSHVDWIGCAFWDLIQPSFMFMVGVSMAYSYVKRADRGDSWGRMFGHAVTRAIILVFLGVFLISNGAARTDWSLMNVLTQIGLGYAFLFLLWRRSAIVQLACALAILVVTCLAYHWTAGEGISLEEGAPQVGVEKAWAEQHLADVPPAWHKNANLGHRVDLVVLNWLPRETAFEFNRGGYQTINFIPSLATMIFGLMIGELIRSNRSSSQKLAFMFGGAVVAVMLGVLWSSLGCPMIKRLWTPSWALFSTGICIGILAAFYLVLDVMRWQWGSIVLVVFGVNSIAVYSMGMLLRPWTAKTIQTHFGADVFKLAGEVYEPMLQSMAVGCCFWIVCYWMYRNKIFVRI